MKLQHFIIIVSICATTLQAQKAGLPKNYTPLSITVKYGAQKPSGILAQRFGINNSVGGGLERVSILKGWIMGVESYFIYGSKVKEDVLKNIRTPEGTILGDIGTYAGVVLKQRGIYMGGYLGKFFIFNDKGNRVSGLHLTVGGGFLKHKIRILNEDNSAQQVASPYSEGYDRMTYGMAFSQSIGYQVISRNKTVNFTLSLDFTEGVTRNRRGFNFDTRQRDDTKRLDFLSGIHATWSIPIFTNQNADDIEY
jgi:hypothetical protein